MKVNDKIYEANNSHCRIVIHQGGTGSGKSFGNMQHNVTESYNNEGLKTSVVSESLPHLRRGCMADLRRIIKMENLCDEVTEIKSQNKFVFDNGSEIEFFGADESAKLRGPRRDILFINECNNVSWDVFQELDARTRIQTILDFNPVRRFWVHDQLIPMLEANAAAAFNPRMGAGGNGEAGDNFPLGGQGLRGNANMNYLFVKSTYKDNQFLTEQEIINIESRRYNPNWWRVYGEGEIGEYEGLIFTNWTIAPLPPEGGDSLLGYGIDFGFSNSSTAIVQVNRYNGELYVKEILYGTGMLSGEIFNKIKNRIDLNAPAIADSAAAPTIAELYNKGWKGIKPCIKGPGSVEHGINALLEQKINVTAGSLNLIKEMREYMWDTGKDGKPLNVPLKTNDHAIDAMRYLVTYPEQKKKKKGVLLIADWRHNPLLNNQLRIKN
jgi:phage terminase large subunit